MNNMIDSYLAQLNLTNIPSGTSTGSQWLSSKGTPIQSFSPINNQCIGTVFSTDSRQYNQAITTAQNAFVQWRNWPAPKRGEVVRHLADALRVHKDALGHLVCYEMGKSLQEGLGEVQEMIDICDFAVGLSRQLYGLSLHSERPEHRMYEQWHPLGIVGIISAFNFPVAVWCWNAAIAWVCGNVTVWKPSEKTPISAIAVQQIVAKVFTKLQVPEGVSTLLQGNADIGQQMSSDTRIPLISATGSTQMGKAVAIKVAERLGKTILELGGNNAIIVTQHADMPIALSACVFGAVGTAGQRCTTTRRVIVHQSIYEPFVQQLIQAYQQLRIGNPLNPHNHVGPLIDSNAVQQYLQTIETATEQGARWIVSGGICKGEGYENGCYVYPCIAAVTPEMPIVQQETFAPILYVMAYENLSEAIEWQNSVPQGLSSSIMTLHLREAEIFLSHNGSDCGIANVNIGTSGAEIGGAFGGEKETGGGRESGSDAWKAYMRRQTNTINWGKSLPLAQGIRFEWS